MARSKLPVHERFLGYVSPEPMSGCWLWTGVCNFGGYGQFWNGKRNCPAHRYSYEACVGPIPDGLVLDHKCRVRCCVNPDHLRPMTQWENIMIGTGQTARNLRKTHCKHGHEFTEENTRKVGAGRICRTCNRAHSQKTNPRRGKTRESRKRRPLGGKPE